VAGFHVLSSRHAPPTQPAGKASTPLKVNRRRGGSSQSLFSWPCVSARSARQPRGKAECGSKT
jgi:hypothetical protein